MLRSPCRYLASLYCRSRWGGGRIRFVVVTHRPRRRRVNHMPKNEAAIAEIKALEDRRYRAMLAGDMAVIDGAALVTGRMTAKVSVAGTIVHVDNRYLAVWVRERRAWKFVAYQPTPI